MPKRDALYDLPPDPEVLRRLARRRKRGDEGGEAVPGDRGPRPLPLEGGAEAPLD